MLEFLFGWRRASKCKEMLRCVRRRLKPLRSKCDSVIKQQREVISHLLKNGSSTTSTFSRVEQLYQDESMLAAYDLLDQFCGFTIMSLPCIRKHKHILDYPLEIIEAVSTLIFTSARLANLPELQVLRKLFSERYGRDFEASAVELYPGNHVNRQMMEKLSVSFVSNYEKFSLIRDICREFKLPQVYESYMTNGYRRWDSQVFERDIRVVYDDDGEVRLLIPNAENLAHMGEKNQKRYSDAVVWDTIHLPNGYARQRETPDGLQESFEMTSKSASVNMMKSGMQGHALKKDEDYNWILETPLSHNILESNNLPSNVRSRSSSGHSSNKRRKSSESNLKDEAPTGKLQDTISRSRRRSSRQSSMASCTNKVEPIQDGTCTHSQHDNRSASHNTNVTRSAKSSTYKPEYLPLDILQDKKNSYASELSVNSLVYSPHKKPSCTCMHRTDSYGDENLSPGCCLEQPCYFVASESDGVSDQVSCNVTGHEMVNACSIQNPDLISERSAESLWRKEHSEEMTEVEEVEMQITNVSGDDQQQKLPPYSRTMSMPAGRGHSMMTRQTLRSASLRRVHPSLPDYDALEAKFTALKREHSRKETVAAASS